MRALPRLSITKLYMKLSPLFNPYWRYIVVLFEDMVYLINVHILKFFRKFLAADYCWFLFSSSLSYFSRRYL